MTTQGDIEGAKLAYAPEGFEKLSSDEGCHFNLVNDKVYNLDEEAQSDDEGSDSDEPNVYLKEGDKIDCMKREIVSLILNSNRDPIRHGSKLRLSSFLTDQQDEADNPQDCDILDQIRFDDGYSKIHKKYKKLPMFDELVKQGFEPISGSNYILKRLLVPGSGPPVDEKSLVIYNCAFWTEGSSEPYDSTWLRHNALVTDISTDSILPGLHELLMTTKKGEWTEALIRPEAAFGPLGVPPRIPGNATIFCVLEVIKVVSRDKIALITHSATNHSQGGGLSFEDFYEASDEARKRGNHYHDTKQYKIALQRYLSGIRILEALTYKDEEEEMKAQQLLVKLFNNSARAANASGNPRLALHACKQASLIDNLNSKTYWNRMIAWKTLGLLDKALGTARRAMQLFHDHPPTKKSFKLEADQITKKLQSDQAALDDMHRLMGSAIAS